MGSLGCGLRSYGEWCVFFFLCFHDFVARGSLGGIYLFSFFFGSGVWVLGI